MADEKFTDISPQLNKKKSTTLTAIMRKGRITDLELMKTLGLKSANSASYYRKDLEKRGIIKRYTAEVEWTNIGYPITFVVLLEAKDMESNFDIEKEYLAALDDYYKEKGDIFVLPSGLGRVVIEDISTCFGERPMTIITGHATSDHDAMTYYRYYVADRFTAAKTTFLLIKGKCIQNFFIKKDYIELMKGSFVEDKTIELPEEFKKRFPSLVSVKRRERTSEKK
ncbi:MAG: Lrp/AsnC family transcriptional regulator [Candidatus Hydrothermarchaeales archaeon]